MNYHTLSDHGRERLKSAEGWASRAYQDSGGTWTIGWGHAILPHEEHLKWVCIPHSEGEVLLGQDVARAEAAVSAGTRVPLTQHQFDALVLFTYNVGAEAFARSTLLKRLNAGEYDKVPNELRRWTYVGKKKSEGLRKRREWEIELWEGVGYAVA